MAVTSQLLRIAQDAGSVATDGELLRRYARDRDEPAFAEVVRRNGPLVLRACRSVLGEASAAEDAFQATFLMLARRANRLIQPGSLAGWLHATAVRIARDARRTDARLRRREAARAIPQPTAPDDLTWREVREVLDVELAALPEKYRLPLVLCYLQELSYEEAARRAGCSVGGLRGRLERAKEHLRKRLARYGLPLAAPVLVLGQPSPVSAALVETTLGTVRVASVGGRVPAAVAGLVGARTGLRVALLTSIAVALVALGVVLAAGARPASDAPPAEPPRVLAPGAEPAPRTDVFGDPLPAGVLVRLGTTRGRAGIHSFGFLADGTVVTVGPNLDVRTWGPGSDVPGAAVLLPLTDSDPYLFPQVSADGRFVTAGTRTKVVVWERIPTGVKEVAAFEFKNPQRLALAPDGNQLAVSYDGSAKNESRVALCAIRGGAVRELEPAVSAENLVFSGDGRRLLAGAAQCAVVWDTQTGKLLGAHKLPQNPTAHPSALDRTGDVIAVLPYTWSKNRVSFLDASTGKPVEGLTGPEVDGGRFVTFAPDGKSILIGGQNGVRWWDPATGKLLRQYDAPSMIAVGFVRPLAQFTPDGKVLVSHTRQTLFRWDAATGKPLFPSTQETGHTEEVVALGLSPDGTRVATAGWETGVRIWDAATGRQLGVLPSSVLRQENLDFSPDGRFLFAPSRAHNAVVKWDVATGKEVARYTAGVAEPWSGPLQVFRLAPDGRSIHATARAGERDARLTTWDVESGRVLSEKEIAGVPGWGPGTTGFSPDGRWGAGPGLLFPVAAGPGANILAATEVRAFGRQAFSRDSRLIAVTNIPKSGGKETARATVLEVATGAKVCAMPVRWVVHFAFHPDGRSLAGAETDGLVFWDLTTGKEYARRKAHALHLDDPLPFARVVQYFPDGSKLLTGHSDTTALVWAAPTRPKAARALDEKERAAAWDALSSPDGAKGWAAIWALADDSGAVALLRQKVKPVEALGAKEFTQLLADLGSEESSTREAATEQLEKAGERAIGQLRTALTGELTAEQKVRVERLLGRWSGIEKRPPTGERLRVMRAVAAAELMGTADARKLLAEWAAGTPEATTTREAGMALERTGR
jgi:RNA polymerase sigma factor (sigma-70 family)